MNNIVNTLQDAGINIIFIDYLQKNDDWILENIGATDRYNSVSKLIVKENNVYFADIINKYMVISKVKNIYEDVTAGYRNHQSDWGRTYDLHIGDIVRI